MLSRFVCCFILGVAAITAASAQETKSSTPRNRQHRFNPLPRIENTNTTSPGIRPFGRLTTAPLERQIFTQPQEGMRTLPKPEEIAKMTTDSLVKLMYTSRPVLAVGTFEGYDSDTSSVLVKIDPKLTSFPRAINAKAKRMNASPDRIFARELRPERRFRIMASTYIVDDTAPLLLKPGEKERKTPKIPISKLKFGDKVSVLYQMERDSETVPTAFNVSKVDPARTYYSADFDPLHGKLRPNTRVLTTSTLQRRIPGRAPLRQPRTE